MESKCRCEERNLPKVVTVMSSYNGEKYIREQIESILNQTYSNIVLYVRDDGSSDGTIDILEEYAQKQKLILLKGKNLGFINSFFDVLKRCEEADYYAWCDQDDIWKKEKIARAVTCLEEEKIKNSDKIIEPVLYFSDYDYYDEKMNFQKHGLDHKRGPSFANSLMDCIPLGFNSVFNRETRRMMLEKQPKYCCGHDWWTYMICAAFGKVIYDRGYYSVQYRRLDQSVSPGGKKFLSMQVWRFKKFFLNDYFSKIREQLREFGKLYGEQLTDEKKKVMKLFEKEKYSVSLAIRKMLYPVWFRQGLAEELMVRILFLIGKL